MLRTWFISLDRLIGPSLTTRDALKKVFLDQVVFAPVLFSVLLPLFGFSQGMNTQQVKDKVSKVNSILMPIFFLAYIRIRGFNSIDSEPLNG